jgi:DNA polymerase
MDALALLRLQIEWGADEALEDAPVDRLRSAPGPAAAAEALPLRPPASAGGEAAIVRQPQAAAPEAAAPPPPSREAAERISGTPAERAAAAAARAGSLDALRAAIAGFDGCVLRDTAASLVFATGDAAAGLLLLGDPPGEAEDRSGMPFAGTDGALLDRMLASIGLQRDTLLLAPLIPWRPPGNRPPSAGEIALCLPFLHRLLVLAAPRRLLIAGPLAARTLRGSVRRRGAPAWVDIAVPGRPAPLPSLVLPAPAEVARSATARRDAWAGLRLLRHGLDADLANL